MQKTSKGLDLGVDFLADERRLIVDAELLVVIKSKMITKVFSITDFNRKIIRYIKLNKDKYDNIIVGCYENGKLYEKFINETLMLNVVVKNLNNLTNYKEWLLIANPKTHLACSATKYFTKNSVLVTPYNINNLEIG